MHWRHYFYGFILNYRFQFILSDIYFWSFMRNSVKKKAENFDNLSNSYKFEVYESSCSTPFVEWKVVVVILRSTVSSSLKEINIQKFIWVVSWESPYLIYCFFDKTCHTSGECRLFSIGKTKSSFCRKQLLALRCLQDQVRTVHTKHQVNQNSLFLFF